MARPSPIPAEQRFEAVMAILSKSDTTAALSRRLKVSEATLYRWRDEFVSSGKQAITGNKSGATEGPRKSPNCGVTLSPASRLSVS